ncbi:protein kinase domain-containing protein, partial [Streptomyces sp. NPDC003877]
MGRVWRAADEILDRQVAVKEMRIDGLDAEDSRTRRERTLREARATARIDHPNVVRIYDVVDEGERLWIVMELVAGRSLERVLAEEGPLGPFETARIGLGLVAALRQVHERGVLHRDIKPGNVLVENAGAAAGSGRAEGNVSALRARSRARRVVLTDFGIAAIQDAKALTMVGMLVGSPDYMAPERISGRPQGPPSDIWSLGATLCAALGGRSPFSRDTTLATLHAVLYEEPELPVTAGPLREILRSLLEKDPTTRPTLEDLETALEPVAFPSPTPTVAVRTPEPGASGPASTGAPPDPPSPKPGFDRTPALERALAPDSAPALDSALAPDRVLAPDSALAPDRVLAPDSAPGPDRAPAPETALDSAPAPDRPPVLDSALAPDRAPAPETALDSAPAPGQGQGPETAPDPGQRPEPAPGPRPDPGQGLTLGPGQGLPGVRAGREPGTGAVSLTRAQAETERRPRPGPTPSPAPLPPGELPGPATPRRRPGTRHHHRRRRTALAAAAAAVATAGTVVAILLATSSTPPDGTPTRAGSTASASPTPSPTPSPTVEGTARPHSLPPGTHREAGGFAWATPDGWRRDVKTGAEVHYTSPDGSQELVGKSSLARGDLLQTWQASERNAQQGQDYRKIRLEETTFRGHPAVVWGPTARSSCAGTTSSPRPWERARSGTPPSGPTP